MVPGRPLKRFLKIWSGPVARGSLMSIVVRIVLLALGFVQAVLTARLLGPEGYGTVAVALAVVNVAATGAMLGFGPLPLREVARLSVRADWSDLRGFLFFSVVAVIGASIVIGGGIALLALATEVVDPHYRHEIAIAVLLVLPFAMIFYFRGVLQGFGHVLASQLPGDVLRPAILVTGLGLLFFLARPATTTSYLAVAIGAAYLAMATAVVMSWRAAARQIPAAPKTLRPRQWSGAGATFLAVSLLTILGSELSTLLLGWLSDPRQTGLYQPVARLAPLMLIAQQAVSIPVAPRVVRFWEKGDAAGLHRMTWLVVLSVTGATILFCGAIVGLAPLILAIFGEDFLSMRQAILIVAVSQVFAAACGPVGLLLSMTGHQRTVVRCRVAGLAVNLALGFLLIPGQGAEGAALAFAAGTLVWTVFMLIAVKRRLGFDASLFGARHLVLSPLLATRR